MISGLAHAIGETSEIIFQEHCFEEETFRSSEVPLDEF